MPKVIQYSLVLEQLQSRGFKSLYHNSGAFCFSDGVETISRGWIGPADASISEAARSLVRHAPEPFADKLTALFLKFWKDNSPGILWIMPKSHWAYELQFGSSEWLPGVLNQIGIDSDNLLPLNNAAAIEFDQNEDASVERFVQELLFRLAGSDFQAVFADHCTICTIHNRTQLWWTTVDPTVAAELDVLLPLNANGDSRTIDGDRGTTRR